jgi:2-polyprenyl-3-methyl-5-hydroxy-6-metoxy-1,4-benzoquinol methylase
MNSVPCNLCGANGPFLKLWDLPDRHSRSGARFPLVRCMKCGLVFLHPRLSVEELREYYPPAYYGRPPEDSPSYRWRLSQLQKHAGKGKLLDYGCGSGGFLKYLRKKGWDVYGLDASPWAVRIAGETLGDRVRLTSSTETGFPDDSFDIVCLFEVFEHLPDPASSLREFQRILKPNGHLLFSVPNFSSWERILFGPWFNGLDAPRHLYQFTPRTVGKLLEKAGLKSVKIQSVNARQIQVRKSRINYCQESLRFFLRDKGLYPQRPPELQGFKTAEEPPKPLSKTLFHAAVHGLEGLVFYPFWFFSKITGSDNTLWVYAQK